MIDGMDGNLQKLDWLTVELFCDYNGNICLCRNMVKIM